MADVEVFVEGSPQGSVSSPSVQTSILQPEYKVEPKRDTEGPASSAETTLKTQTSESEQPEHSARTSCQDTEPASMDPEENDLLKDWEDPSTPHAHMGAKGLLPKSKANLDLEGLQICPSPASTAVEHRPSTGSQKLPSRDSICPLPASVELPTYPPTDSLADPVVASGWHPLLDFKPSRSKSCSSPAEMGQMTGSSDHPLISFDPFAQQISLDNSFSPRLEQKASYLQMRSFGPSEFASELDYPRSPSRYS